MGVKYDDWLKLQEQLKETDNQLSLFIESCAKELAARLLAKAIKRTPVGQYPKGSGKTGGTLRRGWTVGKSAKSFVDSLTVNHFGDTYVITVSNNTEYASYIEYGHRTRNHKGWIPGKFMLTISEEEIDRAAPAILEKKIQKVFEDCFR